MKRIIYTRPDGGVSVIIPTDEFISKIGNEEAAIAAILSNNIPITATDVNVVDDDVIPKDRTFRNALAINQGKLEISRPKAEAIKLNEIRAARDEQLKVLDTAAIKAIEENNEVDKLAVLKQKQALRDLPQNIDWKSIKTIEELKTYWPEELGERNVRITRTR